MVFTIFNMSHYTTFALQIQQILAPLAQRSGASPLEGKAFSGVVPGAFGIRRPELGNGVPWQIRLVRVGVAGIRLALV